MYGPAPKTHTHRAYISDVPAYQLRLVPTQLATFRTRTETCLFTSFL